ncbi:hypothetical protein ACHAPU_000748 [Fusarium lateritium]
MKFFTVFSAVLASGSALLMFPTETTEELINALEPFLNELKLTSTAATKASDDLDERDVLSGLMGSVTGLVSAGMPNFNKIIGNGFNVTASYITSVDLNAKVEGAITWASERIASNDSIPASSLIKACLSGLKTLVAKIDFNTYAASILSTVAGFVLHIDFNTAISKIIAFVKSNMS